MLHMVVHAVLVQCTNKAGDHKLFEPVRAQRCLASVMTCMLYPLRQVSIHHLNADVHVEAECYMLDCETAHQ